MMLNAIFCYQTTKHNGLFCHIGMAKPYRHIDKKRLGTLPLLGGHFAAGPRSSKQPQICLAQVCCIINGCVDLYMQHSVEGWATKDGPPYASASLACICRQPAEPYLADWQSVGHVC